MRSSVVTSRPTHSDYEAMHAFESSVLYSCYAMGHDDDNSVK